MERLGPYLLGPNDTPENGIYTGDALALLAAIPENAIDAILTDPPYCSGGIGEVQRTRAKGQGLRSENIRRFGWFVGDNMGTAGLSWLLRAVGIEAMRICRATGSLAIFCDWRMLPSLEPAIESAGLRWQGLIVWDKGSFGLGRGFRRQHECLLHFTTGSPEYHDRSTGDVITCPRVKSNGRLHQTQKPVQLLGRLINVIAPAGGIVIDPFSGSGSTAVAALGLGRRYLGFEIDPDVAEMSRERLRNTSSPMLLPESEQLELPS